MIALSSKDNLTNDTVDWGKINHPIAPDKFDGIFERLKQHLEGKDLYARESKEKCRMSIRSNV